MKVFEFDLQRFAFDIDYDKLILSGTNEAESLDNPLIGAKIFAYAGDDSIYNHYENVTIDAGAGNDSIDNHGHHALIDGGTGNDTLLNYVGMADENYEANYSTLRGGDGDDFIDNHGHHVLIEGGNGNDVLWNNNGAYFDGEADYSTLSGGDGDDTIRNYGNDVSIDAGEGNDDIFNSGRNVTIDMGTGDDFIEDNNGHGTAYVYTSGNDTIHGFKSYDTFLLGDVSIDSFEQTDGQLKINLSNGNHIMITEYWGFGEAVKTVSSLAQVQRVEFTENHTDNENIIFTTEGSGTTVTAVKNNGRYISAGNSSLTLATSAPANRTFEYSADNRFTCRSGNSTGRIRC